MRIGTVYTETVVHIAPEAFQKDVPYQVAIVEFEGGARVTARIEGERVQIGDRVVESRIDDGVCFFRKDT
jgi:uncharacterized OB-fold protein